MNNKKPRDPLYPKGFEEARELKKQIPNNYPKPNEKDDELTPLKKLNHKIGVYLTPNSVEITDSEQINDSMTNFTFNYSTFNNEDKNYVEEYIKGIGGKIN